MLKRISCPEESDKYFGHESLSVSTQWLPLNKTENVTKIPVTRSVGVCKYPSDITFLCPNCARSHLLDSICFLMNTEVNFSKIKDEAVWGHMERNWEPKPVLQLQGPVLARFPVAWEFGEKVRQALFGGINLGVSFDAVNLSPISTSLN